MMFLFWRDIFRAKIVLDVLRHQGHLKEIIFVEVFIIC
jgi:hypothetical protein